MPSATDPAAEPESTASPEPEASPEPAAGPGSEASPEPGERQTVSAQAAARRHLDAPPSQRYVLAARGTAGEDDAGGGPSLARGALIGGLVALFLAGVLVVLGGLFTFTAGLIVVAVFLGRLTAVGVNAGAGDAGSPAARLAIAVGLSVAGVALAQVGLWLWAGFEGGSLGLLDFLAQVYGALVPLQLLLAGGTAWLSAR